MIGKQISHYKILEKLGEGGMGIVYKAHDTKLDRFVALKFLPEQISTSTVDKERFLQEARAASAINHPNVCTIYDIKEFEGREFIVMEYVEGETLRQKLQEKPLKIKDAIEYAIQIGEALQAAHDKDVVHRDIKSENIMITTKNQVKVMDFGLAKLKGSLKLTKTSSTVGTLAYMAPEQLQGEEVDVRSDIFSCGVVLFEMLSGELPFQGEYESALMYSILNDEPQSLEKLRPDVPVEFSNIITKALDKDPDLRYQVAKGMVADLKRLKRDTDRVSRKSVEAPPSSDKVPLPEVARGKKSRVKWIAGVAIVAILFLVVTIIAINKFTSKEPPQKKPRRITFTDKATYPAISPDGSMFAYISQESWYYDCRLCVKSLIDEGEPQEIHKDMWLQDLRWSPDNKRFLVSTWNDSVMSYSLIPVTGGRPRSFPSGRCCFSHDGFEIACIPHGEKRIMIYHISKGLTNTIPLKEQFVRPTAIDWSRKDLLLLCVEVENGYAIWTISRDGKRQHHVIQDSTALFSPRWSYEGNAILYLRAQGETKDLMKIYINPNTGKTKGDPLTLDAGIEIGDYFNLSEEDKYLIYTQEQEYSNLWVFTYDDETDPVIVDTLQLTTGTALVNDPTISPDGKTVAYSKGSSFEASNIFTQPIEGGPARQLTHFTSSNTHPVWSPEGDKIAFISNQSGSYKVWYINLDNGPPQQFEQSDITATPGRGGFPIYGNQYLSWSPDNQIFYLGPGEHYINILNSEMKEKVSFMQNNSIGLLSRPRYSPISRKLAVCWYHRGSKETCLGIFNLSDASPQLEKIGKYLPIEWSQDGEWIYVNEESQMYKISKISATNGELVDFLTLPDDLVGAMSMHLGGKKIVCTITEAHSDIWLMENFDVK